MGARDAGRSLVAALALVGVILLAPGRAVGAEAACPLLEWIVAQRAVLAVAAAPWQLSAAVAVPSGPERCAGTAAAISIALDLIADVDRADRLLPDADVGTGAVRGLFEGALDAPALSRAAAAARDQVEAAAAVAAAIARVAAPRPVLQALGLPPAKLEAELATAVVAVAQADRAAAGAALALIDRELADEQAAAQLVGIARDHVAAPRDPLQALGLLGTDFVPRLLEAEGAVQAINLDSTRALTASIDADLSGAGLGGLIRLATASVLAAVLALAVRRRSPGGRRVSPGAPWGPVA